MMPRRRKMAAPPTIESVHLPAPTGGLNTISPAGAMPPGDCVKLFNMTAAEYGLRTRLGNREWVTGLTGAADNYVRTIMPFMGSALAGTANKIFCTTSSGIWDVTSSTAAPVITLAFDTTTGDAGYGVSHSMTTAGGHFLLYCDEVNGYYAYSETAGTWTKIVPTATNAWVALTVYASGDYVLNDSGKTYRCDTNGTSAGAGGPTGTSANIVDGTTRWDYVEGVLGGLNPANACFVMVWKSRVWFVQKSSAKAWYLAAGTVYGTATQLDLDKSSQFRQGGYLVGLWNWTGNAGASLDDQLVGVSSGGDVAIYAGSDPASADTFQLVGVHSAGSVPSGRRIATPTGSDLLILTAGGPLPLSKLVQGGEGLGQYQTAKIPNLFNNYMLSKASLPGWAMLNHPEDNTLLVTVPTTAGYATEQLALSLGTQSWSQYRDLPIYSMGVWNRKLYFGTVDGKVCVNDGYLDGVTLANPSGYAAIQWSVIGAFNGLGNAREKQVVGIIPEILCDGGTPAFDTAARYDYDFTELGTVAQPAPGTNSWDTGLWDTAVWGGEFAPSGEFRGADGAGRKVAIAVRGTATSRTVLVGYDVHFRQGGIT